MTDLPPTAPEPTAAAAPPRVVTNTAGVAMQLEGPGTPVAAAGTLDPATSYVEGDRAWSFGGPDANSPDDLARAYHEQINAREDAALDEEEQAVAAEAGFWNQAGDVAADIGTGLFVEGGQAVTVGARDAVNETMDLVDELGDTLDRFIPGTVYWDENGVELTTQNEAERRIRERNGGALPGMAAWGMAPSAMRMEVGEGERPTTTTGSVVENISQFITGFAGGSRVLRGWQAATRAGRIGRNMAAAALGDFAAFDGQEARLSNLLSEVAPEQARPIFDFLAANEDDPELLGRAKAAVEGIFINGAAEAVFAGVRMLQRARVVRREAQAAARREGLTVPPTDPAEQVARDAASLQSALRDALGDPEGPLVSRHRVRQPVSRPTTQAEADEAAVDLALPVETPRNIFELNVARAQSADDLDEALVYLSDRYADPIDAARGGVQTWEMTEGAARQIDALTHMAQRRQGDALNAAQIRAYATMLDASGTRALALAEQVRVNPSLANRAAMRQALSVHKGIQEHFYGARAEAGRALNIFRSPAASPERALRHLDNLLAEHGGRNSDEALAAAILRAARQGDEALNHVIRNGATARTRDMIRVVYTNGLMSNPASAVVNVLGNTGALLLNLGARALAPRLARAFGGEADTQLGEATAMLAGYSGAIRDAFRLPSVEPTLGQIGREVRDDGVYRGMVPGLREQMPDGLRTNAGREESGALVGESGSQRPFSARSWRVDENSPLGHALDIIQLAVESPTNLNALGDDFFRLVNARGSLHASAHRRVQRELADGSLDAGEAAARQRELIETPSPSMLEEAEREMLEMTFSRRADQTYRRDGGGERMSAAGAVEAMRRGMDEGHVPFGTILFPFIRTPANLISMAMRYSPLAPAMARFSEDMAAGGARAEIAKAQWAVGGATWAYFMGMAADGQLTGAGPRDRAQREAMQRTDANGGTQWQPYSIRVGDRWFSYERLDPLGTSLSLIADIGEIVNNTDWATAAKDQLDEIAGAGVAAVGQAFFNKTMLQGATELAAVWSTGDGARAERFIRQQATGLIPFSGAMRAGRRGDDPLMREVRSMTDALRNLTPGLSDELPPQRDLWGRARDYQTGLGTLYDAILPIRTREAGGSAIDMEILDNGVTVSMPQRNITIGGARIRLDDRPDIYSEFVRLAGEPAYEHLNAVAEGYHEDSANYFEADPEMRGEYIRGVIRRYRAQARAQIIEQFGPDLDRMAADQTRRRQDIRAGE